MPLFRYYMGAFNESMKTIIEVKNMTELKKIISDKYKYENISLTCDFYCHDKRNNWDTHIIRIDGDVIGFTNEELKG